MGGKSGNGEAESLLKSFSHDDEESGERANFSTTKLPPGGQHRRGQSEFSFLSRPSLLSTHHRYGSVSQRVLGAIAENAQSSAMEMKGAFVDSLHDADQGNLFFLESSMTRSLSILPEALPDFAQDARTLLHMEAPSTDTKEEFSLGPYLSLLTAVVAVSSNATAMSLLQGVPAPLKLYWKMTGTALILAVFAGSSIYKDGLPKLNLGQWMTFTMAAVCFVVHTLLFVIALNYTTIGNAVIFTNSQAVLLLIGKAFVGEPVVLVEGAGAMVAFAGAMVCVSDSGESSQSEDHNSRAMWGDTLALCSAVAGVGYLTFAKAIRPYMNVSTPFSFSRDPYHGLFGWTAWRFDRLAVLVWLILICNLIGTMGFVRAMKHLDNIIIAVATLMEPMIASFVAFELKVGLLPGPLGWLGNVMVALGTLGVVYPSIQKGQSAP
eukprot:scaffold160925_cov52-Attheya_sp.AAC.1